MYNSDMLIIFTLYLLLYILFIVGLVPSGALYYLRPLFIFLLTSLFFGILFILKKVFKEKYKKIAFPIYLLILNSGFFIILGEFARISIKTSVILLLYTSFAGLLILLKYRTGKIIGITLISVLVSLGVWQGPKLNYRSNIGITSSSQELKTSSFSYGIDQEIKTYSVDSIEYYNGNKGLADWYDKTYWKFTTKLPLNGKVYYPNKTGKSPIVIIVHGNHMAEDLSHNGYDYMLQNLAIKGFIAVSIDQNFLNGNWTTLGRGQSWENDTRGYLILEHLKLFKKWNSDINSKLYNKIDMENIGLVGHSRGGEAVSIAANKNKEFAIKSIIAIAPTDRQFKENINLENISYLTLSGANDGDLELFKGRFQYNRTNFTNNNFNLKASYFIEGANHAQFNTDWGRTDSSSLGKLFYGNNRNLTELDQQEITKQLTEIFFNITLKSRLDLIPYIKNPDTIKTLPGVDIISDYSDSTQTNLYDFTLSTNRGITTTDNIFIENIYHFSNRVLEVKGSGSITFKNKKEFSSKKINLSLSSAILKEQVIILNLYNDDKKLYTTKLLLKPALEKNIFKTDLFLGTKEIEPHFQYFEMPLNDLFWDKLELTINSGEFLIDNIACTTSYQKIE